MIIETARLLLRRFVPTDVDELAAIYADPETMRFMGGLRTRERAYADVERWVSVSEEVGERRPGFWATIRKADGCFIGRCGLLLQELEGEQEAEVAYVVARPFWGQGLATEAAVGIKDYAFANYGYSRLVSIIDPGNAASIRVAEKNGMRYERDTEFQGKTCRVYVIHREKGAIDFYEPSVLP